MHPITFWFNSDDKLRYGDGRPVRVGETHTVDGEIKPCQNGLHSSLGPADALAYNPSSIVWVTKIGGNIVHDNGKLAASERSYLYRVDVLAVLKQWARECALRVLPLTRNYFSAVNYVLVESFLLTGAAAQAAADAANAAACAAANARARPATYAANAANAAAYAATNAAYAAANAAACAHANAANADAYATYAANAANSAANAIYAAAYAANARARPAANAASNKKELQWQNDRLETLIWEEIRSTQQPLAKAL